MNLVLQLIYATEVVILHSTLIWHLRKQKPKFHMQAMKLEGSVFKVRNFRCACSKEFITTNIFLREDVVKRTHSRVQITLEITFRETA